MHMYHIETSQVQRFWAIALTVRGISNFWKNIMLKFSSFTDTTERTCRSVCFLCTPRHFPVYSLAVAAPLKLALYFGCGCLLICDPLPYLLLFVNLLLTCRKGIRVTNQL